jgi:hypothetical protein
VWNLKFRSVHTLRLWVGVVDGVAAVVVLIGAPGVLVVPLFSPAPTRLGRIVLTTPMSNIIHKNIRMIDSRLPEPII